MLLLKKIDGNASFVTCMYMNMIRSILTASTHVNVSTFWTGKLQHIKKRSAKTLKQEDLEKKKLTFTNF